MRFKLSFQDLRTDRYSPSVSSNPPVVAPALARRLSAQYSWRMRYRRRSSKVLTSAKVSSARSRRCSARSTSCWCLQARR